MLFQVVFCFAFVRGYVSYLIGVGSGEGGCFIFSSSSGSHGLHVGSFLLCFARLPWFPLWVGACVGGLVGVFLGLSVGAV